jgi:radical SAM superfamily enzyme YgiQ (UPF0313 family)
MKVLLIDPPFYRFIKYYNRYFPLGLAYLAAVLRDKGHQVLIYDADANVDKACQMDYSDLESKYPEYIKCINNMSHPIWNELRDTLNEIKPDLVGINVFTTKAAAAFRVAEIVKTLFNNVPVVVGGPHPSVKADELLRISPFVDYAVRGEGESCLSQLVDAVENKIPPNNILGLSFKINGQIHHNPNAKYVHDLNQIPYPAKDLLINKNSYTSEDMGLIMTGRGCPFACTFCSSAGVWQRITRFRSVENVIGEIQQVQAEHGTIQFSFKDDTFTIDRKRVLEFCSSIRNKNLKINWECNARVNLIDESLLEEMKSAGCNSIKIGIESGSDRVLKTIMKKGITTTQIKQATKLVHKAGIHWTGYFLMGIPTETKQEMLQTLNLMLHIKPDFASLSVFEPYPGTELLDMGIAAGYMIDDRTLDDYYSISPKYYFMKRSDNRIDTMTDEEFMQIEKCLKTSFHKYNRGTARIFKRAKARSILYRKNPTALFGDVRKFLAWLR